MILSGAMLNIPNKNNKKKKTLFKRVGYKPFSMNIFIWKNEG